jgi:hypothetical protein
VWVQFYGITRKQAEELAQSLRPDFIVPGVEQTSAANNGHFEVRYFNGDEKDKEAAGKLADAATKAAKTVLGETRNADVADFEGFRGVKPKTGTLELWYAPPRQ